MQICVYKFSLHNLMKSTVIYIGGEGVAKGFRQNGDETEAIIRENYDSIYRYCYWKIGNSSDAQDISQETFLRFIENLTNYANQGKPQALLYTIARNLCINWYKKIKSFSLEETQQVVDTLSLNIYEQIEDRLSLQKYINELPEEQQETILLRYGQELKVNDIAVITGTTRFVVMYRLRNALAILKKKLDKGGRPF